MQSTELQWKQDQKIQCKVRTNLSPAAEALFQRERIKNSDKTEDGKKAVKGRKNRS